MLPARLRALARHRPDFCLAVDLRPFGADSLARAGGRQDREFKSLRIDTALLAEDGHEPREIGEGHRVVVLDLADFSLGRQ